MDNFLQQIFPQGKERWIKVLYTNPEEAMKHIRLDTNGSFDNKLGFEVLSIGVIDEFTPQIEALAKLKSKLESDYRLWSLSPDLMDVLRLHIDDSIQELIYSTQLTK